MPLLEAALVGIQLLQPLEPVFESLLRQNRRDSLVSARGAGTVFI